MRRRSDCGVLVHQDNVANERKDLYDPEYHPRYAEAGGVLLADEDHDAKQEQHGHRDPDCAPHARRLGIYLHVGPVVAVADVGAMALVEACAPHRAHAARIYGYRGSPIGAE